VSYLFFFVFSAHTDWGFLTLILSPCKTVGLQLFHEKEWHDVPSVENTLVVNGGDYLSLLTGGKLISPLHRVVSNGQEERYSMCCFYYPDYKAKIPLLVKEHELKGQAASGSYSLLRDQRAQEDLDNTKQSGNDDARSVATKLLNGEINFGDYIVSKWSTVFRKGGAY
jgi:isopenicillin N synthase-like dioxygenase